MLKKGDSALVITGKDKGKTGVVLKIEKNKIFVKGINLKTCFLKKTNENNENFKKIEGGIDISNVKKVNL